MTAISVLYVAKYGFILAADGRCRCDEPSNEEERRRETDEAQKIFLFHKENVSVAWALAGFAFNDEGTFDVATECNYQVEALSPKRFASGYDYVHRLSINIKRVVAKAKKDGRIERFPTNDHMPPEQRDRKFRLFFVGYFRGTPLWSQAGFYHDEATDRLSVRMDVPDLSQDQSYVMGSEKIARLLFPRPAYAPEINSDVETMWLEKYRKSQTDGPLEYALSYIKACCDPAAVQIDPMCAAIGGHIHAAEIMNNGCRWLIPPADKP